MIISSDDLKTDLDLCKLVLNNVGAYVFVKDLNRKYIYANQLTENLFKDRFDSVIGHTDVELFDLSLSSDLLDSDNKVFESGQLIEKKEINIIKSTGEKRVYLTVKRPIFNQKKEIIGLMGISTDISELHILQKRLEEEATTDYLTGLANRRFFFDLAKRTFSEAKRHNKPFSLIMFDIDLFKKINDKYGHPVGDIVINFIGSNAKALLRKEDVLARIGGEEFAILLPNTDIKSAQLIAEKIRYHIDSHSVTGEWIGKITPKISLGVATFNHNDVEFHEIYTRSDKAMYNAKFSGKNKVCIADWF